jgi:hypothetical protein
MPFSVCAIALLSIYQMNIRLADTHKAMIMFYRSLLYISGCYRYSSVITTIRYSGFTDLLKMTYCYNISDSDQNISVFYRFVDEVTFF